MIFLFRRNVDCRSTSAMDSQQSWGIYEGFAASESEKGRLEQNFFSGFARSKRRLWPEIVRSETTTFARWYDPRFRCKRIQRSKFRIYLSNRLEIRTYSPSPIPPTNDLTCACLARRNSRACSWYIFWKFRNFYSFSWCCRAHLIWTSSISHRVI